MGLAFTRQGPLPSLPRASNPALGLWHNQRGPIVVESKVRRQSTRQHGKRQIAICWASRQDTPSFPSVAIGNQPTGSSRAGPPQLSTRPAMPRLSSLLLALALGLAAIHTATGALQLPLGLRRARGAGCC